MKPQQPPGPPPDLCHVADWHPGGRPFEKGVSGNPGGRPKGDATVKELARAHTVAAIETLVTMLQAESERTRVAAAEALLSRGWGTPTAHVETGPPGSFADALDAVKLRAQSDL